MDARKLKASAGAEWILAGFGLLRSPGMLLVGAIFGLIVGLASMLMLQSTALVMPVQLLLTLVGPLLVGGMVLAAHTVDNGGQAEPAHLLAGLQQGRTPKLLATLLPQFAAIVLIIILLLLMVGPTQLTQLASAVEAAQASGGQVDPSQFAGFPAGRMLLWILLMVVIAVLASFLTFTAFGDIMVNGRGAFESMRDSLRACLRNFGAMVVFFVLVIISSIGLGIAASLVGGLLGLLLGDALTAMVVNVVLMAVLMPVVTGAMYYGWKQMRGGAGQALPPAASDNGFEA